MGEGYVDGEFKTHNFLGTSDFSGQYFHHFVHLVFRQFFVDESCLHYAARSLSRMTKLINRGTRAYACSCTNIQSGIVIIVYVESSCTLRACWRCTFTCCDQHLPAQRYVISRISKFMISIGIRTKVFCETADKRQVVITIAIQSAPMRMSRIRFSGIPNVELGVVLT